MKVFWLAMAGALGVLARYWLTLVIQGWLSGRGSHPVIASLLGADFPLGTLFINVSGAFALSLVSTLVLGGIFNPDLRLILGTGFCGGYTTFSTFEMEAENLVSRGAWTPATIYVMGNLVLGYIAILAGRALATRMLGGVPGGTG